MEKKEIETMNGDKSIAGGGEKNQMKKQLGLLEGVAIILGIIVGSGNYSFHCF